MFHSARTLLYKENYREKSHFCLIEAKNLREAADYYGDYSEINAEKMIKKAREFLNKAEEILRNIVILF